MASTKPTLNEAENGNKSKPLLAEGISILGFVDINSKEWIYMWQKLSEDEINKNCKDPFSCNNNYENWQYMDTSVYDGVIKHCFRHRSHPNLSGARHYIKIEASENFDVVADCD